MVTVQDWKAKSDVQAAEKNQAYSSITKIKGQFGKFGPHKKNKNMAKIQCYGCQEYRHYRRDYPKLKKENNKRRREEDHITKEVEEAEKKKSKKEEVIDLHYSDSLRHISSFQDPNYSSIRYGYHD